MQEPERRRLVDGAPEDVAELGHVPGGARRDRLHDPVRLRRDEVDRPRRVRAVLPERRVVVRRAPGRRAIAVRPGLRLVRVRRGARVDHHEAVAAAPHARPVDAVEAARVGITPVDPEDVVLVVGLQDRLRSRRVPRVEHEDGVAGVRAAALAAGRHVEAQVRLRVRGDPVLDLLAVDEADRRGRCPPSRRRRGRLPRVVL